MAITRGYCTLAEVKAALRLTDSIDDTLIENSVEGASRRIDGYCGRFFYQTTNAVKFFASDAYRLAVPDMSSDTGLVVQTDDNGDGTFETTWTLNTDYILEPTDNDVAVTPLSKDHRDWWQDVSDVLHSARRRRASDSNVGLAFDTRRRA
jgi:hypothetical protein